jgi:hypothetical protein
MQDSRYQCLSKVIAASVPVGVAPCLKGFQRVFEELCRTKDQQSVASLLMAKQYRIPLYELPQAAIFCELETF